MNVQILQIAPIRVVMLRHTGSYDGIGPVFDTLWGWVSQYGVPASRSIGIYWDNPDFVAESRLRSAACVEVPSYYSLGDRGGLAVSLEEIAGGSYAVNTFVGPYEDLGPVWTTFTNYVETSLLRKITGNPAFEIYVNDPSNTPSDQLITEMYLPVR